MAVNRTRIASGVRWPTIGLIALAFGLWALALVRYLAEALFIRVLFSSPWVAGGSALGGVATGLTLCFFAPSTLRPRLERAGPPLLLPLPYLLAPRTEPLMGLLLLAGGLALAVASLLSERSLRTLTLAALIAVTLGLYLRTLGRSVGPADTFEFQVVAPTLGVAHPTGYPLLILLGKLFSLLPFGSIAWRVNLTSAVAATAALVVLYRLILRLTQQPLTALLAVMALAFSRVLWSQAVVVEVYALNLLFVAAVLLLMWRLVTGEGNPSTVRALMLLLGLSLTNHLTMVLLLPAVALTLLVARPRLTGRQWAGAVALFLLGLAVYAYIPLRWPALHEGRWMSAGEFLAYITGRQFSGALQWGLLRSLTRYLLVGQLLLEPFGWAGAVLAVFGLAWLAACGPYLALLTTLTFLLYALYGVAYLVPDISVFMLPAHLLMALWMASGVAALVNAAHRLPAWALSLLLAIFALLPLSRIWLNLEAVDQSRQNQAELWGRAVLDLSLAPGAAILADGEKFAPLYYLQQIEGLRPDLDLVVYFSESEYRTDLLARLNAGQTVYLARYLPGLESYALRSLGPLVEVGTTHQTEPPPDAFPVRAVFGAAIELAAYKLQGDYLTLYWRALTTLRDDLAVRLRWVDAGGRAVWTSNGSRPVNDLYPTNAWPVGAVVADAHYLAPPPWLTSGIYTVQVGLFPRFSEEGLPMNGGEKWLSLVEQEVTQTGRAAALPYPTRIALGPAWLIGYDLPVNVSAGAVVPIDLACASVDEAGLVWLTWVTSTGEVTAGEVALTAGTTRTRAQLTAPAQPGTYHLRIRWAGENAFCHWLAASTTDCELVTVEVKQAQEGLANFDGRIVLLDAEVGSGPLRPGGTLPVTLHWRALQAPGKDYTVTVQLLGPDGRLRGQVDSWPAQGTQPTSGWLPGQEIIDSYQVPLNADAPSGTYQVAVSMYLLATMARLPIVDNSGTPVADQVIIGTVEVIGP